MNHERLPTPGEAAWFHFRAAALRLRRWLIELAQPTPRLKCAPFSEQAPIASESRTVLFNSASPAEFALQSGKVQNLRIAARSLHGLMIPAGAVFSFWKNVGRASRRRGFVQGRELREGCVIPNIGGGLCQLSNSLYDVALRAGCEILERHAHTQRLPGSTTQAGRDATVFWNYVDLRFRPRFDVQLQARLTRGELVVGLRQMSVATPEAPPVIAVASCETRTEVVESCETCGVTKCFRNPSATALPRHGATAFVLDKFEPEFDRWIVANHDKDDWLFTPLRSAKYPWRTDLFRGVEQARAVTLRRAIRSRRLAAQGAERVRSLLEFDEALSDSFGPRIPHTVDHIVVSQNLLPQLWRSGYLGGRTFDVLMTRLPIAQLQRTLDRAAAAHPVSPTLKDFRVPENFAETEEEALAAARAWITPHAAIAQLAGEQALKLDWIQTGDFKPSGHGSTVVFPTSTLGRKGCYEMREVARSNGLTVRLGGPILEHADFWRGVEIESPNADWLTGARVVVLPAWVEHWPRRLLRAVAAGIPVIATKACGLDGLTGVTNVETGDVSALGKAISQSLSTIRA